MVFVFFQVLIRVFELDLLTGIIIKFAKASGLPGIKQICPTVLG